MKTINLKLCLIFLLTSSFFLNNCNTTSKLRKNQIKNGFTTVAKLKPARFGLAATVVDNDIYLFGGSSEDDLLYKGPLPTIEKFCIEDNEFTQLADHILPRRYHSACSFERKIYILGGVTFTLMDRTYKIQKNEILPVYWWKETDIVEVFDVETNEIKNLTPLPTPRKMPASVAFSGKIYVIGGTKIEYFEHSQKLFLEKKTSRKRFNKNKFQIIDRPLKTVEIYDIKKDKWSKGTDMPTARACDVVYKDYKIYAIGGYNGFLATKAFEVYDIFSDRWEKLPDLPFLVSAHHCEVLNNKIYVFGDYQDLGRVCQYDFSTKEWSIIKSNFKGCRHAAVVKRKGKIFILGGTVSSKGSYLSNVQVFEPCNFEQ